MRIVVVGGVAAGMSAASRARRQDAQARIDVFERGGFISYGACGLPYVLGGEADSFESLVARTPADMEARGIGVHLHHEVVGIDAAGRTVTVQAGGQERTEPYDELLLATGVSPVRPGWENIGARGVHVLRDIEDGRAIAATLEGGARRAVIIGGGYIGLEMAEALVSRGLSVTLLEGAPQVAGRVLDPEYRERVADELRRNGVTLHLGSRVQGLAAKDGRVTGVLTADGEVAADVVIVAVGVRPNTGLARAAGVTLGKTGAIRVDETQRTNVPGLWAAGDNCESRHRVSGRMVHVPLGLTANRMGRVAGVNMAGGASGARFPGIVATGIFKVFGLGVARTGLTLEEARMLGLNASATDVESTDHARYYRDHCPITVRLVTEDAGNGQGGRLLGAQVLGHGDAVKRIDVVAALLHHGARAADLAEMDLAYAPPFSTTWDVLLVAAGRAARSD